MKTVCNCFGFLMVCAMGGLFTMCLFSMLSLAASTVGKSEVNAWWQFLIPVPFLIIILAVCHTITARLDKAIQGRLTFRRVSKQICRNRATLRVLDRYVPAFNVFLLSEVDQVHHGWSVRERNSTVTGSVSVAKDSHPEMNQLAFHFKKGMTAVIKIPTFLSLGMYVGIKVEEVIEKDNRFQIWFSGSESSNSEFPLAQGDITISNLLHYIVSSRDETAFTRN